MPDSSGIDPARAGGMLNPFPIPTIDFTDPTDTARHDHMVALVRQMLDDRILETGFSGKKPDFEDSPTPH